MAGITFEEIKPPEIDDQFYRPFLLGAMRKTGNEAVKLYRKTVEGWKTKPKFTAKLKTTGDTLTVTVYTDNPIYSYVDAGTKGHIIIPRKAKVSGTSGTYQAGSLPGTMRSSQGKKIIGQGYLNLNWPVPWPGIKAREYTRQISEILTDEQRSENFRNNLQEALNKASASFWKRQEA